MSKLPSVSGKEAVRAFEKLGFSVVRITASHHIMKKPGWRYNITVPVHSNAPVKPGTLRGLIRDAGITVEQFMAALGS